MKKFLHHLFVPQESNNHRSNLLHHKSVLYVILGFIAFQFIVGIAGNSFSKVLGITTDISVSKLLDLTNKDRSQNNLAPVVLNSELSDAAVAKGEDMLVKNYWSHYAPDGTTPWYFIKRAGYKYVYAGENLARGFTTSQEVVDAWMASPTHRENMLSSNYTDVGFAVTEGKLIGENTVLVVEEFGSKVVTSSQVQQIVPSQTLLQPEKVEGVSTNIASIFTFFNKFKLLKSISAIVLLLFIIVLLIDMIIVGKKKVIRLVGHNMDHIIFLTVLLILVLFFGKGLIL